MNPKHYLSCVRPALTLCHGNQSRTGSAVRLQARPAAVDGYGCTCEGGFVVQLAAQDGENAASATYDWLHCVTAWIGFSDACEVLRVLRGIIESAGDGLSWYLRRVPDGSSCELSVSQRMCSQGSADEPSTIRICLTPGEAVGLAAAVEGVLGAVCFGVFCAPCNA